MPKKDYAETLLEAIDTIALKRAESVSFDQTLKCTITENKSAGIGKYKVTDGSVSFYAYAQDSSYKVDDEVYVLVPAGDFKAQKMIIGKYTSDDEKPYIYESPFDQIVDMTGNLISGEIDVSNRQLLANRDYELFNEFKGNKTAYTQEEYLAAMRQWEYDHKCTKLLWSKTFTNSDEENLYTRIGLQADFSTYLNAWNVIEGNFGLRLMVKGVEQGKDENTATIYEFTLDKSDMYGNPYLFEAFHTQETAFDISGLVHLSQIELYFFQNTGSFIYNNGEENLYVPYKNSFEEDFFDNDYLAPNLFVRDPYLCLGYSRDEVKDGLISIVCNDEPTYKIQLTSENRYKNNKTIYLTWIHLFEEGAGKVNSYEDLEFDEIRWYRYVPGAPSADENSGNHYQYLPMSDYLKSDLGNNLTMNQEKAIWEMIYYPKWFIRNNKTLYLENEDNEFDEKTDKYFYIKSFMSNKDIAIDDKVEIFKSWLSTSLTSETKLKIIYKDEEKTSATVIELLKLAQPNSNWNVADITKDNLSSWTKNASKFLDPGALGKYKKLFKVILEPDTTQSIEKIKAIVFHDGKVKKSNILEFENTTPVIHQQGIDFTGALEIRCDDNTNGNYYLYDLSGIMWHEGAENTERVLSLHYYPEGPDKGETEITDLEFLEWILPIDDSMLSFPLVSEIQTKIQETEKGFKFAREKSCDKKGEYKKAADSNDSSVTYHTYKDAGDNYVHIRFYYFCPSGRENEGQDSNTSLYKTQINYKINKTYSNSYQNNTVEAVFQQYDNAVAGDKDFNFGVKGTAGTRNTFTLKFSDFNDILTMGEVDEEGKFKPSQVHVQAILQDDNWKTISINSTDATVEWKWYNYNNFVGVPIPEGGWSDDFLTSPTYDGIKIKAFDNESCTIELDKNINLWQNRYILQATLKNYEGQLDLVAYLPIPIRTNSKYTHIEGTQTVTYNSNGVPYATDVGDSIANSGLYKIYEKVIRNDVAYSQQVDEVKWYLSFDENTMTSKVEDRRYLPQLREFAQQYLPITSVDFDPIKTYYTKDVKDDKEKYIEYIGVEYPANGILYEKDVLYSYLAPAGMWVDNVRRDVTIVACDKDKNVLWSQPLLILQHRYPSQILNDWDGKLKIDEENNYILAAKMGAGKKNSDNTFSGVVMGAWSESSDTGDQGIDSSFPKNTTGLWGMHHGLMSFGFLDNGTGFIGKSGKGRIVFDGNNGLIHSGNWDGKVSGGKITTRGTEGMAIELQEGHIDAYNFELTSQGIYLNSNPSNENYLDEYYLYIGDGAGPNASRTSTDPHISFTKNGKLDIRASEFSLTSGSIGGDNLLKNTEPHPYGYYHTDKKEYITLYESPIENWMANASDTICYKGNALNTSGNEYGIAVIPTNTKTTDPYFSSIRQSVVLKANTDYTFSCSVYSPRKANFVLYPYGLSNLNYSWTVKYVYVNGKEIFTSGDIYYSVNEKPYIYIRGNLPYEDWISFEITFSTPTETVPEKYNFCFGWNDNATGVDYLQMPEKVEGKNAFLTDIYPRISQVVSTTSKTGDEDSTAIGTNTTAIKTIEAVSDGYPWLLYHAKLEKGTVASGWTPHSEDSIDFAYDGTYNLNVSLGQQELFNRLTNGYNDQGIFLSGGKLYINANRMAIGVIASQNWLKDYTDSDGNVIKGGQISDYNSNNPLQGGKIVRRGKEGMAISLHDGHIDAHDLLITGGSELKYTDGYTYAYNILLCSKPGTGDPVRPNYYLYVGNYNNYLSFDKDEVLKIKAVNFNLTAGSGNNIITIDSAAETYPLKIGNKFSVEWDGTINATSGEFQGTIYAQNIKFWNGKLITNSDGNWEAKQDTSKTPLTGGFGVGILPYMGSTQYEYLELDKESGKITNTKEPKIGIQWHIPEAGSIGSGLGLGSIDDEYFHTKALRLSSENFQNEIIIGESGMRLTNYADLSTEAGRLTGSEIYLGPNSFRLGYNAPAPGDIVRSEHQMIFRGHQILLSDNKDEKSYAMEMTCQGYLPAESINKADYYYSSSVYGHYIYKYEFINDTQLSGHPLGVFYYTFSQNSTHRYWYIHKTPNPAENKLSSSTDWILLAQGTINGSDIDNFTVITNIAGYQNYTYNFLKTYIFTSDHIIYNPEYDDKVSAANAKDRHYARVYVERNQMYIGATMKLIDGSFSYPWSSYNEWAYKQSGSTKTQADWTKEKWGVQNPHGMHTTYGLFIGGYTANSDNTSIQWTEGKVMLAARSDSLLNLQGKYVNIVGATYIENLTYSSDRRLKMQIVPLDNNIDNLFDGLKPCSYLFKKTRRKSFGFIAQDVLEICAKTNYDSSYLVDYNKEDEHYTLDYNGFIALNTSQIQKLKYRVAQLEQELQELKEKLK